MNSARRTQPSAWQITRRAAAEHRLIGPLAGMRWLIQASDGMVQAALAGVVLINPESATTPLAIALGFATILLPYTLVGPFIGPLLDRFDRRLTTLIVGMTKAAGSLALAAGVAAGMLTHPIGVMAAFVVVLILTGLSRFVLAGLGAALPHVVPERLVVPLNSALTTLGAVVAGAGALVSFLFVGLGAGSRVSSVLGLVLAALAVGAAALVAASIPPRSLGPRTVALTTDDATLNPHHTTPEELVAGRVTATSLTAGLQQFVADIRGGARVVARIETARMGFISLACHRAGYGVMTLVLTLLMRGLSAEHTGIGIGGFSAAIAAVSAGMGAAAVTTPLLIDRLGTQRLLIAANLLLAVTYLVAISTLHIPVILIGAVIVGLGGQTIKLCLDAAMQRDIPDHARGRVFTLQDATYNGMFVIAMLIAVPFVDPLRQAGTVVIVIGLLEAAAAVILSLTWWRRLRRDHRSSAAASTPGAPD